MAVAYRVAYDWWGPESKVTFGPAAESLPGAEEAGDALGRLQRDLPGYAVAVVLDEPPLADVNCIFFQHEDLSADRVQAFAAAATDLLENAPDVFALSDRTRRLTEHGLDPRYESGTDPLKTLELARREVRLTCRDFALIYGAACRARGYTTRLLGLSLRGTGADHAVAEVYVPDLRKWILIDPDFNVAYRQDGRWLNAYELQQAWGELKKAMGGDGLSIETLYQKIRRQQDQVGPTTGVEMVVLGEAGEELRRTNLFGLSCTGMNLEFFEYVTYAARNDYLSAFYPPGHPKRSTQYLLMASPEKEWPGLFYDAYPVESLEDLYWPVGRSRIEVQTATDGPSPVIDLRLATWTPNFSHFESSQGDKEWHKVDGNLIPWQVGPGANRFRVRSVNRAGLRGEESKITVTLERCKG